MCFHAKVPVPLGYCLLLKFWTPLKNVVMHLFNGSIADALTTHMIEIVGVKVLSVILEGKFLQNT